MANKPTFDNSPIGRSKAAIYILTSKGRIPFHKEGKKVWFFTDELREWAREHPARGRG